MTEATRITADEALAAAMGRHSLARPGTSVEDIASDLVGLHNTSPVSPYLSLLARFPAFTRADLEDLMWESWRLARFRAMRLTLFVFPHDLLEIAAAATRHLAAPFTARWLRDSGLTQTEFDRLVGSIEAALADGPLTVRSLRRTLGVPKAIDLPGIVSRMCDLGLIVGGAAPRNWRSSVREYHRWENVIPAVDVHRWDEEAAIRELIRRYVRSYGPVTVEDISWWTGMAKSRCRRALAALDASLEEVAVDDWPGPLYRERDGGAADTPGCGVAALPMLDPYVQGYRDRGRLLDQGRHEFVYDAGGNATATLVHRGRIIGVWQLADGSGVRYHLFVRVPASVGRAAELALDAAGRLYFDRSVDVVEIQTMSSLHAAGGRSAAHPLV